MGVIKVFGMEFEVKEKCASCSKKFWDEDTVQVEDTEDGEVYTMCMRCARAGVEVRKSLDMAPLIIRL